MSIQPTVLLPLSCRTTNLSDDCIANLACVTAQGLPYQLWNGKWKYESTFRHLNIAIENAPFFYSSRERLSVLGSSKSEGRSSHLHFFTFSHIHIFSSSHFFTSLLHIFSYLLIFTSSHLHIFSHLLHIFSNLLIFTSSHLLILHLLTFSNLLTSSHIFSSSSSHLHIF